MVNLNALLSLLPIEFNWKWAIGLLVTLFVAVVVANYFLKPAAVQQVEEIPVQPTVPQEAPPTEPETEAGPESQQAEAESS